MVERHTCGNDPIYVNKGLSGPVVLDPHQQERRAKTSSEERHIVVMVARTVQTACETAAGDANSEIEVSG